MTTEINYSRPVGWWCPVSQSSTDDCAPDCPCAIPVFLPLPTPEPVDVDEVETGEAEVCTIRGGLGTWQAWSCPDNGCVWPDASDWRDTPDAIRRIAAASADARKKRGMK